jgi:6-pyruvoyltetrahydropterin/6-carboxytetrahydropterin synthase
MAARRTSGAGRFGDVDGFGTKHLDANYANSKNQFTIIGEISVKEFMKMELRKSFQFEAAHLLPYLPKAHKCRRLHGHSFKVEVVVTGECDARLGWLMDYADISAAFKPIWGKLDHNYLNKISGLENPTSEIVAIWIWKKLKPKLPLLVEVVVAETCTARAVYRGE